MWYKIRPGHLSVLAKADRLTVELSALQNWLNSGAPIIAPGEVQFLVTPIDLYFSTVSPREDSQMTRTGVLILP